MIREIILKPSYKILFKLLIIPALFLAFTLPAKEDPVVAKFGKYKITLEEYKLAYMNILKQPKTFDSPKLREDFLDEMISGKILAAEAKKVNLDQDEILKFKVEAYRNKCLREKHFDAVIKPKIKVTEDQIEEAYLFSQEERKISHLFCKTKPEADSLYNLIKAGASFDELAKTVFTDTALSNHGGDLGWVTWDELDFDLAMMAFRLPVGKISEPVKSQFGYHIVKVTDFKKKPMITRQEYEMHRRKAKYLLEYKMGDQLASDLMEKIVKTAKITVNTEMLQLIEKEIKDKFKRKPSQYDQMAEVQLRDSEVKSMQSTLWDRRKEEVAKINGKSLTAGDFLGYLSFVPYQVIYTNFKATMDVIFRDFIITQQAKQMKLSDPIKIDAKTELYKNYLLGLAFRQQLVRNVTVDEDEIVKYYQNEKGDLKKATFDKVHDIIKDIVKEQKKRDVIPEYLKVAEKNMKIEKHYDIIHKYYDGVLKGDIRE